MADEYTRQMFAWLKAVAADSELDPLAFKLGFAISQRINRKTRECFPTQETLARDANCSVRTVRRLLDQLADRKHIHIKSGRGRKQTNVYSLLDNRTRMSSLQPQESGHPCPH